MAKARVINTRALSSAEILVAADKLEARACDPKDRDDPKWLKREARYMRAYALKRAKARIKKADERRKNVERHRATTRLSKSSRRTNKRRPQHEGILEP